MQKQNLFIVGLGAGIAIGVALHNLAIGTALGVGLGLALSKPSADCINSKFKFKKR